MKNVWVKAASLALAGCLMVGAVAGCSGDPGNSTTGGSGRETYKIGGIGPTTGTAATYGTSVRQGAELAIKEINAAGGVNGKDLELMFEDDQADGAKAKSAYEKLMDKGMQILLGAVTSGASVSLNDLVAQDGILQVTPSATQIEAVSVNDNAFRICFTDPMQGQEMAKYAYNTLGYRKAAVIYNQDDSYSTGIYEAFKETWVSLGGTMSADTSFAKDDSDFSAQMTTVKSSDAEFLFMPIYAEKAAQIAIAASNKDLTIPMLGSDGMDGILSYLEGENAKLVEGMIYLTPFVATDTNEKVQKFVKDYQAAYGGATPDQFAANAYDAVYVIKAALEIGDKDGGELDNDALVAAMLEVEVDGITGHMTFQENGESNKGIKLAKIVNGEYVALEA